MATSPSSAISVAVLDASCLMRGLVDEQVEAMPWLDRIESGDIAPAWPALLYVELAHGLVRLIRAGLIEERQVDDVIAHVWGIRALVRPVEEIVGDATTVALGRGLSVYDALYVVLAESLDAPLVTADRRLAEATEQAVLLPG